MTRSILMRRRPHGSTARTESAIHSLCAALYGKRKMARLCSITSLRSRPPCPQAGLLNNQDQSAHT